MRAGENKILTQMWVHRVVVVVGSLFLLAGCRLGWGEGAPEPLTVYTALSEGEAAYYLADFAVAYPEVAVELVSLPLGTLRQRLYAEQAAPQADVIWGVPVTTMLLFEWGDLLLPYAPQGLERVRAHLRDPRPFPHWVGTNLAISALCVSETINRVRFPTVPASLSDLLDPMYRRSLVMSDPVDSPAGLIFVMTVLDIYGEQGGWQYLDELHKNIGVYVASDEEACLQAGLGEYPIAVARYFAGVPNVRFVYLKEGIGSDLLANALVRRNPVHPAAQTFLDWSISEIAMRLYARRSGVTGVETGFSPPAGGFPAQLESQLYEPDIPWTAANLNRILAEWQRRYGGEAE